EGDAKFNLNYLDIPVLAVFKLGDAAEIHVGPYFGYLLSANTDVDGDIDDFEELDRDNFKAWDYGLSAGVGFNVGAAQIGARYNYGLQKIAESDVAETVLGDAKNQLAQIYVSFNFNQ
ncbi:MAG TPA: porin family protein, partial [Cyclobacteriaceae bacterium]|nr:porin family protein [Cyclobacteriaceae bacterium]